MLHLKFFMKNSMRVCSSIRRARGKKMRNRKELTHHHYHPQYQKYCLVFSSFKFYPWAFGEGIPHIKREITFDILACIFPSVFNTVSKSWDTNYCKNMEFLQIWRMEMFAFPLTSLNSFLGMFTLNEELSFFIIFYRSLLSDQEVIIVVS